MIAVRYITLVALVVWLGAMMGAQLGHVVGRLDLVGYGCGATLAAGLVIMKFMGPPPRGFRIRIAMVAVMLAIAAGSTALAARGLPSSLLAGVNLACGFGLLFWYVRE
jgi:hypothetical protein